MGIPYAEVIGDPIGHSKSPLIHNFWLGKMGIEGDYHATRVTQDELASFIACRRDDPAWRGCNVAMPHKARMWRLLGYAGKLGRDGIVNCVARGVAGLEGHNFDTDALMRTIPPLKQETVVIIGSGGAARAAIEALRVESVIVLARNGEKARALLEDTGVEYGRWYGFEAASKAMSRAAGVINATPLGMAHAGPMPANLVESLGRMAGGAFACDMVYQPFETEFLARARALGLTIIDGLTMLVEQAGLSFERFFSAKAPREHDVELRELLTQ